VVEVVLRAVRVDVGSAAPLLLLEEVHGPRVLPIYIGAPEATAIAYALQDVHAPRPMTHDLLGAVIAALGAKVASVEVTGLVENTYHANLRILSGGSESNVSCRPSDAIALALRVGAAILVNDELMAAEGREMDLSEEVEEGDDLPVNEQAEAELVEEWREFLDSVKPEDFET
jgi:uncharacterized protein